MARPPERSVTDALFDPLPEDIRQQYNLDEQAEKDKETSETSGRDEKDDSNAGLPAPRPNAPKSPWQLRASDWLGVAKTTFREIGRDRVTSVAGGVTFFGLLALFPAITALVSIYGLVADPETIGKHLNMLEQFVPPSALDIVCGQIESIASSPGTALSVAGIIGLLAALWSANGGMKALIDALNVAWFTTEKRGLIKLNLLSLGMTLGAMLLIILLIGAIAVLPAVLNWLPLPGGTEVIVSLIRWPIMFAVLMLALAALYRFGPSRDDAHWHWISPGALLATIGLIAASALFSWYAANFANYNETYGSLGAVVALMMWLWLAAIVVMMGAELNSETERHIRALNGEAQPEE